MNQLTVNLLMMAPLVLIIVVALGLVVKNTLERHGTKDGIKLILALVGIWTILTGIAFMFMHGLTEIAMMGIKK